eukprot:gene7248-5096_t
MGKHRGGSARGRRASHAVEERAETPTPHTSVPAAPLKEVMAMNRHAMSALQAGDMDGSHEILSEALEIVQEGLAEATVALRSCPPDREEEEQGRKEAWLLALSVTLSNLGCQLRKANKSEEALAYLYRAKEAEAVLYGKPSSSTMLNISAILLGRGDLKESLEIARDCVAASVEGDKVLHITALHNLAMALGQQLEETNREDALQTMHRCLDEAERHLGIAHPTTAMIRDRCLHPERWVADEAYVQRVLEARRHGALSDAAPRVPQPTTQEERVALPPTDAAGDGPGAAAPQVAEEEEAAERSTMRPGKRVSIARSADRTVGSSSGRKRRQSTSEERAEKADKGKKAGRASILKSTPRVGSSKGRGKGSPKKKARRRASSKGEAPREEPKILSEELQLRAKRALESLELGATPYPLDKRVLRVVPSRNLPPLPAEQQPPAMAETNPVPPLPPIAEGSPIQSLAVSPPSNLAAKPPSAPPLQSSPRSQQVTGSSSEPIGWHAPPSSGAGEAVPLAQPLTSGRSLHVDLERSLSIDQPPSSHNQTIDTVLASKMPPPDADLGSESSSLIGADKVDPKDSAPVTARSHHKAKPTKTYTNRDLVENGSFLRFAAVEDSGETKPFSAVTYKQLREKIRHQAVLDGKPTIKRAVKRTPSPTPVASVGELEPVTNHDLSTFKMTDLKARREELRKKQLKEEEQYKQEQLKAHEEENRKRRFQEGLAIVIARTENRMATIIQRVWQGWWRSVGKPRRDAQRQRAAERQKRVHNRQVNDTIRKNAELKGDWTLSGLPPPIVVVHCKNIWIAKTECLRYLARHHIYHNSRSEREIYRLLSRAQARIRGVLARARFRRIKTARVVLFAENAPMEEREYAALLIQKLFRCHRARRILAEKHRDHYEPAATVIQEWYRMVMFDQRARGVDTRTVQRRLQAIVRIQKTWRGYLGRVKYYMALLRRDMDGCRIAEQRGARLLQRAGRGFLQRRWLGNNAIDQCVERMERQRQVAVEEEKEREQQEARARRPRTPVVPRTEYEKECLERADEVYREQQRDREEYDVPLYLEPEAQRQRQAWTQAIRLNPTEVRRRRAEEDLRCHLEFQASRRERAAIKIQREFRAWLNVRDSKDRDTDYLTICKGVYHQREYERILQEKTYLRQQAKGIAIYGDVAAPQRECVEAVRAELKREIDASPDFIPASEVRSSARRREEEKRLQHDEGVLSATLARDMKRLRENPVDVKQRTGAMYENPTLRGLPSEGFQKLYDLD